MSETEKLSTVEGGTSTQSQQIASHYRAMGVKHLSSSDVHTLAEIAASAAAQHGAEFYGWKNAPQYADGKFQHSSGWGDSATTTEISPTQALAIYEAKLNGAYGERFLLTVATVSSLVEKGHKVALLQLQDEPGVPFDAKGWVVISVNGYPLFHVSPDDLPMEKVAEAGIVSLVEKGTPTAEEHGWKGTNKVEEYAMILRWATTPAQ